MSICVLFVDDDADVRRAAAALLGRRGMTMLQAANPDEAWSVLAAHSVDLVLLDLNFSARATTGVEGFGFLAALLAHDPGMPVVVVTGHSGVAVAVAAMRAGAADFVMKPWNNDRLVATLAEAAARRRIPGSTTVQAGVDTPIVGHSPQMEATRTLVFRIAPTAAPILLFGEAGTGKSLLAHIIHRRSDRAGTPLATIDPASLWADGQAAVTAAFAALPADGTLFLDEVGGLSAPVQAALAARLAERADLRLIAATRIPRDLAVGGAIGRDLLYRLNTVEIALPPLRERTGDAILLAEHFLRVFADLHHRPGLSLSPDDAAAIAARPWPGNIRALRHAMERAVVLAQDGRLRIEDSEISGTLGETSPLAGPGGDLNLSRSEKAVVQAALKRHGFNVSHAARALGLTRAALYRRMARHGL